MPTGKIAYIIIALAVAINSSAVPIVARAMQGEQAGLWSGKDRLTIASWIGHCAVNRLESSWFQRSLSGVITGGFYGYTLTDSPDGDIMDVARLVVGCRLSGLCKDVTNGAIFMYSSRDLRDNDDLARGYHIRSWEVGEHGLHFFSGARDDSRMGPPSK
jgi:hypothetical protein